MIEYLCDRIPARRTDNALPKLQCLIMEDLTSNYRFELQQDAEEAKFVIYLKEQVEPECK
jgi:hypothetical protein